MPHLQTTDLQAHMRPRASPLGPEGRCTLAEISSLFGVTPRALRFYESRGLLTPQRNGAARHYGDADRGRLTLILKYKALGFTLSEIRTLADSGGATEGAPELSRAQCVAQINLLERQKRDIDEALTELRRAYSSHYTLLLDVRDSAGAA